MEDKLKKELQHLDGVKTDWDIIMAEHTSLRVGGPVFCLLRPLDLAGLQNAVQVLNQNHYPYFILGRGTNLLAPNPCSIVKSLPVLFQTASFVSK